MPSKEVEKKHNRILVDFYSLIDRKLSYILYCRHHLALIKVLHDDKSMDLLRARHKELYEDPFEYSFGTKDIQYIDGYNPEEVPYPFVLTSIVRYVSTSTRFDEINLTILCHNAYQASLIDQMFNKKIRVIFGELGQVNVKNFSRIMLDTPKSMLELKNLEFTDICILGFRENFSKDDPLMLDKDILKEFDITNSLTIIDPYPGIKLKKEPKNE